MDFEAISRRTFVKRTTVLMIGLTSGQLFAGIEDLALMYLLYQQYSAYKRCEGSIEKSEPENMGFFGDSLLIVMCNAPACDSLIKPVCGRRPKVTNGVPDRDGAGAYVMEDVRVPCGDPSEPGNNTWCLA